LKFTGGHHYGTENQITENRGVGKELQTLEAQKKKLEAQQREDDRKKRTNRLCERGGFIESVLPDTVKLDKAQFQDFIKRTLVTEYARRELNKLLPPKPQEPIEEMPNSPSIAPAPSVTANEKPSVQAKEQA
jgi:hypothetical protein